VQQIDVKSRVHWLELRLCLPADGVREAFPNTASCRERWVLMRWPGGVTCPLCEARDITHLESRQLYQCRTCRKQFSATAGTVAHQSRLDLRAWFIAAEDIIHAYSIGQETSRLTGHYLAQRYGISYTATHRFRKLLVSELRQPGGGLVGACVCIEPLSPIPVPGQSLEDRFDGLYHELWKRTSRAWRLI